MQWRAPWAGSRHRLFFLKRGVGALLFHLMLNVMFSVDTAKRITLAGGRKGEGRKTSWCGRYREQDAFSKGIPMMGGILVMVQRDMSASNSLASRSIRSRLMSDLVRKSLS